LEDQSNHTIYINFISPEWQHDTRNTKYKIYEKYKFYTDNKKRNPTLVIESIKGINSGEFIIANFLQNLSCLLASSVSKQYRSDTLLIKLTSLPFT